MTQSRAEGAEQTSGARTGAEDGAGVSFQSPENVLKLGVMVVLNVANE